MAKSEKNIGVEHINNMVPSSAISQDTKLEETAPDQHLEDFLKDVSSGAKKTRLLIDLLAVSVSPLVCENGWTIKKNGWGEIVTNEIGLPVYKSINVVKGESVKVKSYGKTQELSKYENMKLLLPDDFFEWFFKTFDFLEMKMDDEKPFFEDIGGGEGFNAGRKYFFASENETDKNLGAIQFRYFDPSKIDDDKRSAYKSVSAYAKDPAEVNYVRQKINLKLTGDGLQVLRSKKILWKFLLYVYKMFREPVVTMFDTTCDMFNYGVFPRYFADLEKENKFVSRSGLNIFGPNENPTVYIGQYKADSTIMMYDKLAESNAKKGLADEPELIEAVESRKENTFFRIEQHHARKEKNANQAFSFLINGAWDKEESYEDLETSEREFYKRLSSFFLTSVNKKCRFLVSPKKENHTERIKNDVEWQKVLDAIGTTYIDFAYQRPVLDMETRKYNYIHKGLGGNRFLCELAAAEGREGFNSFLEELRENVFNMLESYGLETPEDQKEYERKKRFFDDGIKQANKSDEKQLSKPDKRFDALFNSLIK